MNKRIYCRVKFFFSTVFLSLGLAVVLQGCVSVPEKIELDALKQPLLVVIDDPRSERQKRQLQGVGYSVNADYNHAPVLERLTKAIAKEYELTVSSQWPIRSLGVHCFVIETPSDEVLAKLNRDNRVKWVQPFNEYQVQSQDQNTGNISSTSMQFPSLPNKGEGIDIVVIDTGVDLNHPALSGKKLNYKDFVKNKGVGYKEAHGTAVVGLIAAQPVSNSVVEGLVSEADIHHFRGCWQEPEGKGMCNTLTLALALDEAVSVAPDLINLSLTGPADPILNRILQRLLEKGTLVISAHDEGRTQQNRFPQAQTGVIYAYGVEQDSPSSLPIGSMYAPANALSLAPNGKYDVVTGHSIATPHLTALAASMLSGDPNISNTEVVNHMKQWFTIH